MKSSGGMTLVELVIVATLIAILLGLAVPAYRQYGLRAHRTQAVGLMLRAGLCQERVRAESGFYDTRACRPADSTHYQYSFAAASPGATLRFSLEARPLGEQRRDRCGTLILEHTGERRVALPGVVPGPCWAGR
jgi:type IV pilus assembly protein PilE